MALTVSEAGKNSRATSGGTLVVSSVTASVGDMLVAVVSAANSNTSGTSSLNTVTDSASNTWTDRSEINRTAGVANDGVSLGIYTTVLTSALSSGTVTASFSPTVGSASMLIWRVQPGTNERVAVYEVGAGDTGTSPPGSNAFSLTTSSININHTLIGAVAVSGSLNSSDSDTTNGSWSTNYTETGSSRDVQSQYKTVTATATQTYNATASTSTPYAINYIVLTPVWRLYLPSSSDAPAISPSADSGWEKTSDMDRIKASISKTSTAMTSVNATKAVNNTAYDIVRRQYIYGPLQAGTIAGSVLSVVRSQESNLAADASAQLSIRVIAPDASTVRGTAIGLSADAQTTATEFNQPALANRFYPIGTGTAALTEVAVTSGDYLVMEYGVRGREAGTTTRTFTWRFGDIASSDLAQDQTSTTDNNPWIDFYSGKIDLRVDGSLSGVLLTADAGSFDATVRSTVDTALATATAAFPDANLVSAVGISADIMTASALSPVVSFITSESLSAALLTATADMHPATFPSAGDVALNAALMEASTSSPDATLRSMYELAAVSLTATASGPDASIRIASTLEAAAMTANASLKDADLAWSGTLMAAAMTANALAAAASLAISSSQSATLMTASAALKDATEKASLLASSMTASAIMPSATSNYSTNLQAAVMTATAQLKVSIFRERLGHVIHRVGGGTVKVGSAPSGKPTLRGSISGGRNEH